MRGDTQGGLGPLTQDAVGFEAVPDLKPFHPFHQVPLVGLRNSGRLYCSWKIAEHHKLTMENVKFGIRLSRMHGGGRRRRRAKADVGRESSVSRQHGSQKVVLHERGSQRLDGLVDVIIGNRGAEQCRKIVAFGRHVPSEPDRAWVDASQVQMTEVTQHCSAQCHIEAGDVPRYWR